MKSQTLNLKYHSKDTRYRARLAWQFLYNVYVYQKCDTSNLDSLLCDLYTLESYLRKNEVVELYFNCFRQYTTLGTVKDNIDGCVDQYYLLITPTFLSLEKVN